MNNDYQDYQLEDMEDNAVNKSNTFKKAAVIGGAALGVGGTAVYAATKINGDSADTTAEADLTTDDILEGAEAGGIDGEVIEETTTTTNANTTEEVHIHHHYDNEVKPAPVPAEPTPEVSIDETGIIYDEEGNVVSVFDRGTIDGKDFTVVDTDGNGYADTIAYDANGNGVYEENEIASMDNTSYQMGQGQTLGQYLQDNEGHLYVLQEPTPMSDIDNPEVADINPNEKIHNDFIDEKNDGEYDDIAKNNPDYNNNYDHNYGNAPEEPHAGLAYTDDVYEEEPYAGLRYTDDVYEDETVVNDNLAYEDVTPSMQAEIDGTPDFVAEDVYEDTADYDATNDFAVDDYASNDYSADTSFTDDVDFTA